MTEPNPKDKHLPDWIKEKADETAEELTRMLIGKADRREFSATLDVLARGFMGIAASCTTARDWCFQIAGQLRALEPFFCTACGTITPRGKARESGLTIYCPKCDQATFVPLANVDLMAEEQKDETARQ